MRLLTIFNAAHEHQQNNSTLERHDSEMEKDKIQKCEISFSKLWNVKSYHTYILYRYK